jgi:2-iminobutanoate/2-iminopropanoate deaminase
MSCKCKQIISLPKDGPKAIGPYSLGIATRDLIFTSGQLGLDPKNGELVPGGIEAETRQALENLNSILKSADSELEKVIKTTVFLKNITDFAPMNAVYAEYFHDEPPARTTIQAGGLPKNALVEIEAIALAACDCDCEEKDDEANHGCGCGCGG